MIDSTNPVDEYKQFKNNLLKLFDNVKILLEGIKPIFNNSFDITCKLSKKITNVVCNFEENINTMYKYIENNKFSKNQIDNIKNIVHQNESNIGSLYKNIDLNTKPGINKSPKLTNNISSKSIVKQSLKPVIKESSKSSIKSSSNKKKIMSGGAKSYYYISDPISKKKYLLSSLNGLQLLENYIYYSHI